MESFQRIGSYAIIERIGHGGFSTVYKCRDVTTDTIYAVKIGTEPVNDEYKDKQPDEMAYMEEWNAYKALNYGKGAANRHGIPQVVETGIAEVPKSKNKYSYLIMQLLGKSLSATLGRVGLAKKRVFEIAHAAIETLKYIHGAGYIHRDIKPANFCFGSGSDENSPPLRHVDFVGTPDYASTPALRGSQQSYRDDMESLAYTLLELMTGDLPWYLTASPSVQEGHWTHQNLCNMASRRERKWKRLIREKKIPLFLVTWVTHCKSLGMIEKLDYDYFHRLVEGVEQQSNRDLKNKRKSCTSSSESPKQDTMKSPKKRLCQAEE